MAAFLQHPYALALAWALVHFLWQGAVIAVVAFALTRLFRLSASARYVAGIVTLAIMLVTPAATFVYFIDSRAGGDAGTAIATVSAQNTAASVLQVALSPSTDSTRAWANAIRADGPAFVLMLWLSGVIVLAMRLLGGWVVTRRLVRRAVQPVAPEIRALVQQVSRRLALSQVVGVFESAAVSVPMMIGWVTPVVLLPAAALSGLAPAQLEALLAHELAHVRRHDYLVNILQSFIETLLFYHPAVWWVSSRVRADREHCCDDLAVGVCDRLVYVTALAELAAIARVPRIALAATDGSLINRVRRILGRQSDDRAPIFSSWTSLAVVLVAGVFVPAALVSAMSMRQPLVPAIPPEIVPHEIIVEATPPLRELLVQTPREQPREVKPEEQRPSVEAVQEIELEAARAAAERAKRLFEVGLISRDAAREAEMALKLAEQRRSMDREKLEMLQRLQGENREELERKLKGLQERFDSTAMQQSLEQAKEQQERVQQLFQKGLVNAEAVRKATDQAKSAEAQLLLIQAKLALSQAENEDVKARLAQDFEKLQTRVKDESLERMLVESKAQAERMQSLFEKGLVSQDEVKRAALEAKLKEVAPELRELRGDLSAKLELQNRNLAEVRSQLEPLEKAARAFPPQRLKSGDLLMIQIGEPDGTLFGRVPWDDALTVGAAVSQAGGSIATGSTLTILRADGDKLNNLAAKAETKLRPGDVIVVRHKEK